MRLLISTCGARADHAFSPTRGVQGLLIEVNTRPSLLASGAALLAYALLLAIIVTYRASPPETIEEQPLELVLETPAAQPASEAPTELAPVVEPPPAEPPVAEETPPEPQTMEPPPPEATEPDPVAPVVPPKPVQPKIEKKVEKKVEHRPVAQRPAVARPGPDAAAAPSNAVVSNYANIVYARILRSASYPRSGGGTTDRVSYHIVIGPSGELISKSISATGNAVFDSAASEALSRAAPFPPSGASKSVALSGAIVFRPR